MRILTLLVLVIFTALEIGPVPITGLFLMWIVLTRPHWFLDLVMKIYRER